MREHGCKGGQGRTGEEIAGAAIALAVIGFLAAAAVVVAAIV